MSQPTNGLILGGGAVAPDFCVGSGAILDADQVRGDRTAMCPQCKRIGLTYPVPSPADTNDYYGVEVHRPRAAYRGDDSYDRSVEAEARAAGLGDAEEAGL